MTLRIAYIMSRFPKISETFVLYEILELRRQGLEVELFPLMRERQPVVHPEAERLAAEARYQPFLSWGILKGNWKVLRRAPGRYLGVLLEVLRGTWPSRNFLLGAIGIFPKTVLFALEMERLEVDHVHAHFATHPAVAALIVHRLSGIPCSFTAHGSDLHVDRTMLPEKCSAASFVVTVSDYNRRLLQQECGQGETGKIHVVRCGVDPDLFPRPFARRRGTFQILCVASLEEVKGHSVLIQACRILEEQGVDLECHLVGDGPRRGEIAKRIKESGLEGRIVMHGPLARPEVIKRLLSADVKVLASVPTAEGKREGIPVVLIEAMAASLPVVASDLSGIPELVEDGISGLLFPPGNADALSEILLRLQGDSALRLRLGQAARRQVVRRFSLQGNCEILSRLFRSSGLEGRSYRHTGAGSQAAGSELPSGNRIGGRGSPAAGF